LSLKPLSHRIKEGLVKLRNLVLRIGYRTFARPVFFQIDPEKVHSGMMKLGSFLGSNTVTIGINSILFSYANSKLEQNILNIRFANPVGLAAGFDKNAEIVGILSSVGFGHAEIGSVTGEPCAGNPKPRLWRLKKSSALVVNYGLKNDGCNAIAARLKRARSCIPLGVSIAKTNCKETTDKAAGIADIKKAFLALKDKGDYLTINISCPNAFGGQPFTYPSDLDDLLSSLETLPCKKPVFLKLPPDLTARQVDGILRICDKHRISGFVCSNLTKDANNR
jgi:dihydroorotate dehydrogenase